MDGASCTLGAGMTVATLRAASYDMLRALGGRRSERQLRALRWIGEVERIVPLVSRYGLPAVDPVES